VERKSKHFAFLIKTNDRSTLKWKINLLLNQDGLMLATRYLLQWKSTGGLCKFCALFFVSWL
jgi:hypothetical protein